MVISREMETYPCVCYVGVKVGEWAKVSLKTRICIAGHVIDPISQCIPEGLEVTYLLGTPPACMNQSGSGEPEPTSHCEHFPEFPKKVVQIVP